MSACLSLVDQVPVILYMGKIDYPGTLFISPQVSKLTGYPPADWLQPGFWFSLVHPEDQPAVAQLLQSISRDKPPQFSAVYRLIAKDGRVMWFRDQGVLVDSPEHGVIVKGAMMDITADKEAQETLRQNEERLRLALIGSGVTVWDWNIKTGSVLFTSNTSSSGIAERKTTLRGWINRVHPDDRKMVLQVLRKHLREEHGFWQFENRIATDSGYQWRLSRGTVVHRDQSGRPLRAVGWLIDVTEQKLIEESRQQATEKLSNFQSIVNRSPAVVFVWRVVPGWPVDFVSENVDQFGYSVQDLVSGKVSWPDITHPDDVPRLEREVQSCIERGLYEMRQEYRLRDASGKYRWVEDRTLALRDQAGNITHFQGIVLDISERKQAEESLRIVRTEMDTLREKERRHLARELHDAIGQGMVAMLLELKSLWQRVTDSPAVAAEIEKIASQCSSLFRDVRRISQGLYPAVLEQLGLCAALRQLADNCAAGGAHCTCHCPDALEDTRFGAEVEIALYRIAQTALNNAVQHSGCKHIWIKLGYLDSRLSLIIGDDGSGFDPGKVKGKGLGIVSMHDRAAAINADLSIKSEPGQTLIQVTIDSIKAS